MKKSLLAAAVASFCALPVGSFACSGAVISGAASADGGPILWKNRDTTHFNNGVVFVKEEPFSYLGITNEDDPSGRRVWAGMNSAGFAVMNTVAYNLPSDSDQSKDLEGWIMADALRTCRTAEDFESYLGKNMGPALGSQANFGVIDGAGGAAIFEVYNTSFTRLDADKASGGYLLVTNFSRSGGKDKGKGYVRYDRLTQLFSGVRDGRYSIENILLDFSRDLRNPMLGGKKSGEMPETGHNFIHTVHTIDRASTVSAVVFQGVKKGESPKNAKMWVMLGEPVCAIAVPLWVEAGEAPFELQGATLAPLNLESMRLRSMLRPFPNDEHAEYLDLSKLENKAGTGWLPVLRGKEKEIMEKTVVFLRGNPDKAQKSVFQKEIAADVLKTLKAVK